MPTTTEAAEATGVRYETLRNWLKKGLLADQISASAGATHKWRNFSAIDIFKLRLTKDALSAGVPLNVITEICNDPELDTFIEDDEISGSGLSVFPGMFVLIWTTMPEALYMFAEVNTIPAELKRNRAPATLLSLEYAAIRHG